MFIFYHLHEFSYTVDRLVLLKKMNICFNDKWGPDIGVLNTNKKKKKTVMIEKPQKNPINMLKNNYSPIEVNKLLNYSS